MKSSNTGAAEAVIGEPTLAIAFGCGGARGFAHIHVIEALDELGVRPTAISGCSIGAIMGVAMASGMSGREIKEHALAAAGSQRQLLSRVWRSRPASMKEALSGGLRLGQFNLERLLRSFLPERVPDDFSALALPMKVVATDFYAGDEVVLSEGPVIEALAASASIPAVFLPVRRGDRVLVDGGLRNPVPYDHLSGAADITVAVDVAGYPEGDGTRFPTAVEAVYGASQLLQQSVIEMKLRASPPDIFLRPRVGSYRALDFLKAKDILELSAGIKDETKRAVEAALLRTTSPTTRRLVLSRSSGGLRLPEISA